MYNMSQNIQKLTFFNEHAPLTSNHDTIKDSFLFVEEVFSFDWAHYMTSFDITSLFTIFY